MTIKAAEKFKQAMNRHLNPERKIIELDCAPGAARPDTYIADVIRDTGLPIQEPVSKVFGNWTWDYTDVPGIQELWPQIKPMLKERISKLYDYGHIRYGSW